MEYLRVHVGYFILITIAAVASYLVFTSWKAEHDARLISEIKVQAAEVEVKSLQQQIQDRSAAAAIQIATLQKQSAAVKTTAQAIAAIPEISNVPLNLRALPDNPAQVGVDAVPLFQELSECRQQSISYGVCQANLKDSETVIARKDSEVASLKKRPAFWKRVGSGAKKVAIGIAIGLVVKGVL